MSVLGLVIVAASAVYVLPKVFGVTWAFGMTEMGRFAVTWLFIATVYDLMVNNDQGDAFSYGDAVFTGVGTFVIRQFLLRRGG